MFSREFAGPVSHSHKLQDFLGKHFVFVQPFMINEQTMQSQHRPLVGYSMGKKFNMKNITQLIPPNQQL